MRIVTHLIRLERLGGVEVNTLEATCALAARGHEVHVLYGAPLHTAPDPQIREVLESAGVVLHGPFPFASTLKGALPAVLRFLPAARLIGRLRPDVIWLQRPEQIIWGQTVARLSRTPLVSHLHHTPNYVRMLPFLNRGVTLFIAVSEFMFQRWVAAGIPANHVAVLLNAVPPGAYPPGGIEERTTARQALGLPADLPTALYYGRLEEGKGITVILDAWERIAARPEQAHLVLAGDLPPYTDPQLRERIAELVRKGTVTLLPNQGNVVPLLHAADLVLFPSLLQEAFGRAALESIMTERPVLASDTGAVPEILAGPLARLLLPPGDSSALAAGITALLDWRRQEPDLGLQCRLHAVTSFSYEAYLTRLEQLLDRAAASGHRRRKSSTSSA